MQLLQSWSSSLAIFKPANLKLFLLVTLKSIIEAYKVLFAKFWHLVLAYIVVDFFLIRYLQTNQVSFFSGVPFAQSPIFTWLFVIGLVVVTSLVTFFMFLVSRPSVTQKNYDYVFRYIKHFCYFILFVFLLRALAGLIMYPIITNEQYLFQVWVNRVFAFLQFSYSIIFSFFILFFLDAKAGVNEAFLAMCRAVKMWFYTLPFTCIVALLYILVVFFFVIFLPHVLHFLIVPGTTTTLADLYRLLVNHYLFQYFFGFLYTLGKIIPICFLTNFYIKNIHENFTLYFKQKGA